MPAKKTSFVWKHFTKNDCKTKATCNHCQKEFNYSLSSMSNLGRHLKKKHLQAVVKESSGKQSLEIPVYSVQEVGTDGVSQIKTFEITVNGFNAMDQDFNQALEERVHSNWTAEPTEHVTLESSSIVEPSKSKNERKPTKRSAVWDHFEKSWCKTSAECLHCGKTIKMGTISNLARHLRHKHPTTPIISTNIENPYLKYTNDEENVNQEVMRNNIDICTEVIEITVDDIQNPENVIEMKTDGTKTMECEEFSFLSEINNINVTQESQTEFLEEFGDFYNYLTPKKASVLVDQVNYQIVKMIVKGCHPVSIVEECEFRNFVKLINANYELPSVNKVAKDLIPEMYRKCESKACKSLDDAEGICLYIDQWKSKPSCYMCVTAHFINTDCKFESLFLSCSVLSRTENASDIKERLTEVVKDWDIAEKIIAVVTDNSEVISTAVTLCNWPHIPHFIRSLSLVLHEGLNVVKTLVFKVKNVIEELTKNPETIAKIYLRQREMKLAPVRLITKVKNDWHSSFMTLEMLTRFSSLQNAICHVQENYTNLRLTENEWKILKGVVEILHIFKTIREELMKENRTCFSKIYFYIRALKRKMKTYQNTNAMPSDATYVATITERALNIQFEDLEKIDMVTNILLLDPRLKKHVFENESEFASACSKLKKEVCEAVLPEPQNRQLNPKSLWHSFDEEVAKLNSVKDPIGKGILELENYLQEQLLFRDSDPLIWWGERRAIYPRMFRLAKKYLCVTAKSTPRESISFKTVNMLSHLKHCNESPSESEMLFLHHNM